MAVTSLSANSIKEIVFNLQMQLKNKGISSSKNLLKNFLVADIDRSGFLNREEFEVLLQKSGIFLSRMDITYLMRFFDKNKDGKISFNEFYDMLVPELNARRSNIVNQAWEFISNGEQTVTIQNLCSHYDINNHPQVASGSLSAETISNRFLEVFDAKKRGEAGLITENDFKKAHRDISSSFPIDDDAFVRMMECVWNIRERQNFEANDINQLETLIKEKIRLKMVSTETEAKALIRFFKFIDLDNKGWLSPYEFDAALQRFGVHLNSSEIEAFYQKYDLERSGTLDYTEFSKAVGGNNSHLFSKSTSHTFYR